MTFSDIPADPLILLSFINTKLRDFYPSLDELADDLNLNTDIIKNKLRTIDYHYDTKLNRFI